MRLLLAMAGAAHGGAEAFFERLAGALVRRSLPVEALIRHDGARAARLAEGGVPVIQAPFGGPFDWRTRRIFRREIARFQPDVVLTFMSRAARFCPASGSRRFLHVGRLGGYYDTKYFRTCDHLIANTPDIARYLRGEGIGDARVHHVPNFVDEAPAEPFERAVYDTPADAPLLVAMGRFHRNKAFDVLIRALSRLPGAYLWLAGEGDLRGDLEALAAALGVTDRIRFLGWVQDAPRLIETADAVVVPSRHEPLGNVVLEAWAREKPVAAAASEGPGQLIEHDVNGLLCAVDDPDALAAALRRLLDTPDLAARIAAGGRAAYRANYSEAAVTDAYVALLNRLCEAAKRGTVGP